MISIIEASKFEPEPTFENTINDIKENYMKSIASAAMNLLAITLDKPYSSSEHLKYDLMPWILLQSPEKSPQFTKHLSLMQPKGKTQLQIRKWWVPLRSEFYISFFGQNFVHTYQ